MDVTKEQVERMARACVEYDDARNAVFNPGVTRWRYSEPLYSDEAVDAFAEAAGAEVVTEECGRFRTRRVEAFGVEFYHVV